ncbi:MAG TPA: hypothetical protein VJ891_11835 [Casimicrobiaceae bacterium]|nr:hypothetical protein [Casimicrobiaceae bacterium]
MAAPRTTGQGPTAVDVTKAKASTRVSTRARRSGAAERQVPEVQSTPTLWDRLRYGADVEAAGTWPYERRLRNSSMVFVERRKGSRWKYGSIVICAALWATLWLIYRR